MLSSLYTSGSRVAARRYPLSPFSASRRRWLSALAEDVVDEEPVRPSTSGDSTSDLSQFLRPSEIVKKLDDYVVGQQDAKRAVAIALRNRWRRRMLPDDMKKEITPKNVLLVGPTGKFLHEFSN